MKGHPTFRGRRDLPGKVFGPRLTASLPIILAVSMVAIGLRPSVGVAEVLTREFCINNFAVGSPERLRCLALVKQCELGASDPTAVIGPDHNAERSKLPECPKSNNDAGKPRD